MTWSGRRCMGAPLSRVAMGMPACRLSLSDDQLACPRQMLAAAVAGAAADDGNSGSLLALAA
eukprot:CAMPEP_0172844670 /NCGR_PEP_ID=MMETSP1075-20121228/32398_1 /TAXON_ID=2916 /ORGANISM="Ceratium fusus, Strain PA161109" /LENGTH=61 /DNA_ID=CAMNT_0013689159 /DNA_START=32 /DNA_END=218 /DNA_ORIENTATION=+